VEQPKLVGRQPVEEQEYYAPWEWQPIEFMPNGCNDVVVRDREGNTRELCSCDYWWLLTEDKKIYTSFRFV
jgi:hypothetical protein